MADIVAVTADGLLYNRDVQQAIRFAIAIPMLLVLCISYADAATTIITIDGNGFSTSTVTMRKGDTVEWVNKDAVAHWPASGLHPTHLLYPEFDPKRPINPGNSWSFTFEKPGTWRWHDHLNPATGGIIIVLTEHGTTATSSAEVPQKSFPLLIRFLAHTRKVIPRFVSDRLTDTVKREMVDFMARDISPDAAFDYIRDDIAHENGATGAVIHAYIHIIGHALYDKLGLRGLSVCGENPFGVGEACYHGVMEKYFLEQSAVEGRIDTGAFATLCNEGAHSRSCLDIYHGLGHGFMSYYGLDLEQSLNECLLFSDTMHVNQCITGVFMEWSESSPFTKIEALRAEPWKLCTSLSKDIYRRGCAFEMPRMLAFAYEAQQSAAFDIHADAAYIGNGCASAPTPTLRMFCFSGAGAMATIRTTDSVSAVDTCESLGSATVADKRQCLAAAAQRIQLFKMTELSAQMDSICSALAQKYDWPDCLTFPVNAP